MKISIKNLRRLIRESMGYEEKINALFNMEDDTASLLQAWELANLAAPELVASGAFVKGPNFYLNNEERVLDHITPEILEELDYPDLKPTNELQGWFRQGEFAKYGRQWVHHNPTKSYVLDKWDANDKEESKIFHEIINELWTQALEYYKDSYFEVKIIQDPSGVYGKDNMDDRGGEAILTAGSGQKYRLKCYYDDVTWGVFGGFVLSLFGQPR